jgi:hypothetical protein
VWPGSTRAARRAVAVPSPRDERDSRALSLAVFAALQGGLGLSAMSRSIEPLRAALDGALVMVHAGA